MIDSSWGIVEIRQERMVADEGIAHFAASLSRTRQAWKPNKATRQIQSISMRCCLARCRYNNCRGILPEMDSASVQVQRSALSLQASILLQSHSSPRSLLRNRSGCSCREAIWGRTRWSGSLQQPNGYRIRTPAQSQTCFGCQLVINDIGQAVINLIVASENIEINNGRWCQRGYTHWHRASSSPSTRCDVLSINHQQIH